ncbi:MAG: hypothetical protein PVI57_23455 [Gemmatimonadota bacterium]|jgi:Spy/CpxP family protein refolding chaperone
MNGLSGLRPHPYGTVALLALLLAAPAGLAAQQRGGPPGQREELQRRLQTRFGQIVSRQLGLEREQQQELSRVLREGAQERRDLLAREQALRVRLRAQGSILPTAEPAPLMPEEQAREVLAEMRAIREAEANLRASEEARLLEILTPAQLVRFYAVREQLNQRIRRLQQGPMRGGGPGGPGPPGR